MRNPFRRSPKAKAFKEWEDAIDYANKYPPGHKNHLYAADREINARARYLLLRKEQ